MPPSGVRSLMRPLAWLLPAAVIWLIPGCTVPDDTSHLVGEAGPVAEARRDLVGLSSDDIRMCAGFPSSTFDAGVDGEIWSYERSASRDGLNVTLPSMGAGPLQGTVGSVTSTSTARCRVQMRMVDNKMVQIEFAGDNNSRRSLNALCTPIIDGCVAYVQHGREIPPPPKSEDADGKGATDADGAEAAAAALPSAAGPKEP